MYVIANKGLGMSPGKLAAQVGHATIGATFISDLKMVEAWKASVHRWHLVLEAQDTEQLTSLAYYLDERAIATHLVCDEGANEVRPFSLTALGVEIVDKDDAKIQAIFGSSGLRTYRPVIAPTKFQLADNPAVDKPWHWTNYAAKRYLNRRGRKLQKQETVF